MKKIKYIFIFILTISILLPQYSVGEIKTIPEYDWIINNYFSLNNTTLDLDNKELIVIKNGEVIFYNVTIFFKYGLITIEDGKFTAENCTFTSKSSEIGLAINIFSNNVSIRNSIISNLKNGIIIDAGGSGKYISPLLEGNTIMGNGFGIFVRGYQTIPKIINNTIMLSSTGLKIWNNGYKDPLKSKTIIANNKFFMNRVGISLGSWYSGKIENTTLRDNYIGIWFMSSTLILYNSTFANSYDWDFYISKGASPTTVKLFNTTFDENKVYFEDYDSTIELPNKTLRKERDYTIYIIVAIAITIITLIIIGIFLYKRRRENKSK